MALRACLRLCPALPRRPGPHLHCSREALTSGGQAACLAALQAHAAGTRGEPYFQTYLPAAVYRALMRRAFRESAIRRAGAGDVA